MSTSSQSPVKNVLLCGYGNAGRILHAPLISAIDGLNLAGVVTSNPDRGAEVALRYPHAVVRDTVEQALEFGEYDLVVVASANVAHVPQATAALNAGIATVIDKPIAGTVAEANALIELAGSKNIPLSVFQNRRWDNDFLTVRQLVEDGKLGDVLRFESFHDRFSTEPSEGWRESGAVGDSGGLLYDVGSHLIDQALTLFGPVSSVYAEVDTRRPGAEIDDDTFVALTHESGVRSHLSISLVSAQRRPRFHVSGTRASYVKYGFDPQEDALASGANPATDSIGTEESAAWGTLGETTTNVDTIPSVDGSYIDFYRGISDTLHTGASVPVNPSDAVHALRIIEAAQTSDAEGRVVTLTSRP